MKKCPKCGYENSADSLFCEHCGTKLPAEQAQPTAPKTQLESGNSQQSSSPVESTTNKQHDPRRVALVVIAIVIVVAAIGYFLGGNSVSDSDSSSSTSSTATSSKSETSSSSSSQAADKLVVSQMDDKMKAAAVYYYGSQHMKQFGDFQIAVKQGGLSITDNSSNTSAEYDKGDDPTGLMPLHTGAGAVNFYTTDGNKVYFYIPSAIPGATSDEDATEDNHAQPVLEATWQQIADYVNSQDAYDQVKGVADGSETYNN